MIKRKRKKKVNRGNSFLVVIATISFLAILTTALLVAIAMCYRMKAYDINTRDNFYYLEQAMDEIYEGVGAIAMDHLTAAYNETAEVMVYFDPVSKSYVTMDNTDANKLMKSTFVNKLKNDTRLTSANIENTLSKLISYSYNATTAKEGVQLTVGNVVWSGSTLTIQNLILKRQADYSTVNTTKGSGHKQTMKSSFIQSITTDLVISQPDFEIKFGPAESESELYDFVLIGDMGVEFNEIGTKVNVNGNVYAAADFYNKEYNKNTSTGVVATETEETRKKPLNNKINSYNAATLAKCDGVSEKSMYSGFYVSGAKVTVMADKFIVPGSIAAMNCGDLTVLKNPTGDDKEASKIWADGIVLGGYSRSIVHTSSYRGSNLKMTGDAYVYDDLEVNAVGSTFKLKGNYYGYNYATTDNRKYSDEFIAAATNRKYLNGLKINDGNYIGETTSGHLTGQAHYNSSAIIVNGDSATLDLSDTNNVYVAGQAYVELSKSATTQKYRATESATGDTLSLTAVSDDTTGDDIVSVDSYEYKDQSVDDNYTLSDIGGTATKTRLQDYRTGEGVSIKSNQLAYIPPYNIEGDETTGLYVKWPTELTSDPYFSTIWSDLEHIPLIKSVIGGNEYYFYDFSKASSTVTMNKFMEAYAALFTTYEPGYTRSNGERADLYDITNYEAFRVYKVLVDGKVYSNSAISVKRGSRVTITADSKQVSPLLEAKNALDTSLQPTGAASLTDSSTSSEKTAYAKGLTSGLQKEYKEMKMLLTNKSTNAAAVAFSYTADEGNITPINYYFNFEGLNGITEAGGTRGNLKRMQTLNSGYQVFLGEGDMNITSTKDSIKGIVICKGDVSFGSNIKEFEGLVVSGGKIRVEHSMNFVANREVIKSILRECDESRFIGDSSKDLSAICRLFRHYDLVAEDESTSDGVVPMKNMTSVLYEDMLAFDNWKKNVD